MESMNLDNIVAGLEAESNTVAATTAGVEQTTQSSNANKGNFNKGNFNKNTKRFDGWKDDKIEEVNPVKLPLTQASKTFTFYHSFMDPMTQDEANNYAKLLALTSKEGYTCRICYPKDSILANTIKNTEGLKLEFYLPFKNYNDEVYEFGMVPNTELPYQISKFLSGKDNYSKLQGIIRGFRATAVQLVLGRICTMPSKFVLIDTPCGTEVIDKNTDWKKTKLKGSTDLVIRLANQLGIPVINLHNKDTWQKRFIELISDGKELPKADTKPAEQSVPNEVSIEIKETVQEGQQIKQEVDLNLDNFDI